MHLIICTKTWVISLWKQPTLVCQSLSVMEKRKKKNHHDNSRGEGSLWWNKLFAWFWFLPHFTSRSQLISHVINRRLRASYQAHKPARIVTGNLCELLSRESLMLILLKELDVCLTKEMKQKGHMCTDKLNKTLFPNSIIMSHKSFLYRIP